MKGLHVACRNRKVGMFIAERMKVLSPVCNRVEIVPPFLKLLRDSEAEVRVAAASKVASVSNLLDAETVSRIAVLALITWGSVQSHAIY